MWLNLTLFLLLRWKRPCLVGDFPFVSKFHYGARIPMTPIAIPFFHHTIPSLDIARLLRVGEISLLQTCQVYKK
jgi:signal peptidase I